jgi:hypothetical protein
MRTKRTLGAALALLALCASGIAAQSTSGEELTVEERFLRNIEFQILR